jgi:hypothetical protein
MPRSKPKTDRETVEIETPQEAAIAEFAGEAEGVLIAARKCKVTSDPTYINAGLALKDLTEKEKELRAEMQDFLAPVAELERKIRAKYTPALDSLAKSRDLVKAAMNGWCETLSERHAVALRAAEAAEREGKADKAAMLRRALPDAEPPAVKGVSIRSSWCYEILDPEHPKLAPFRVLDESKVKAAVKGLKEAAVSEYAGALRVWVEYNVAG